MDTSERYTTQQQIKIIEAYFAAQSVVVTQWQCREDFGRNNVPDGRTIQHLVAKFRKTGIWTDADKGRHRSFFSIIPENIQNLQDIMRSPPENQHAVSHKKLAFRQIHF